MSGKHDIKVCMGVALMVMAGCADKAGNDVALPPDSTCRNVCLNDYELQMCVENEPKIVKCNHGCKNNICLVDFNGGHVTGPDTTVPDLDNPGEEQTGDKDTKPDTGDGRDPDDNTGRDPNNGNNPANPGTEVDDPAKQGAVGEPCKSDSFVEYCTEDQAVIYCKNNVITRFNCNTDKGMVCAKFSNINYADCQYPTDECSTAGEHMTRCGGSQSKYYSADYVCEKATNGKNYYNFTSKYQDCEGSCIPSTGQCGKLVSDEGADCNVNSFTQRCDDNIAVYCSGGKVTAKECTSRNSVCAILDRSHAADCYSEGDKCSLEGSNKYLCDDGFSLTYECSKASDGNTYFALRRYEDCEVMSSCDDSTGKCKLLTSDQGSSCRSESFTERCDGNIIAYCKDNVVTAANCELFDSVCATIDGQNYANCFAENEVCTKLDEVTTECGLDYGIYPYSATYQCMKASDGKMYKRLISSQDCLKSCDSKTGKCDAEISDLGTACDASSFEMRCDNNVMVRCIGGKVTATDCASEGSVCAKLADTNQANCFKPEDECTKVGEQSKACALYADEYPYIGSYTCMAAVGGKNYKVRQSYDFCNHDCDPATVTCTKLIPEEGTACDDSFVERCDGEYLVYCVDHKVVVDDCAAIKTDTYSCHKMKNYNYASCFRESDVCYLPDTTSKKCEMVYGLYPAVATYLCATANDGRNYSFVDKYDKCDNQCDSTLLICK